jgi:hypothetical protein
VRFLTPQVGPNSSTIATWGRSICRTDALPNPRLTRSVRGLHLQLKHLIAVSDPIDHFAPPLATVLATSAETVIVVAVPSEAGRTAAFARSPKITRVSRR